MIRAIRFKNESRLGDPRSPAEKLAIFINKTSCEVLNVVVTSTVIFENSSYEKRSWADEILLIYRRRGKDGLKKRIFPGSGRSDSKV
jgi:hypothetical protein